MKNFAADFALGLAVFLSGGFTSLSALSSYSAYRRTSSLICSSESSLRLLPRLLSIFYSGGCRRLIALYLAGGRVFIGDNPDIGINAGVVEHLVRQGDYRIEHIALDNPAANIGFAGTGIAGKQR